MDKEIKQAEKNSGKKREAFGAFMHELDSYYEGVETLAQDPCECIAHREKKE